MPVQKLAVLAAARIPFNSLEHVEDCQREPIHRYLSPFIRRVRLLWRRTLESLCECNENGECLCYFGIIRTDMIEQFWATELDYQYLGDWCEFP